MDSINTIPKKFNMIMKYHDDVASSCAIANVQAAITFAKTIDNLIGSFSLLRVQKNSGNPKAPEERGVVVMGLF
jgi:hypothetical protein